MYTCFFLNSHLINTFSRKNPSWILLYFCWQISIHRFINEMIIQINESELKSNWNSNILFVNLVGKSHKNLWKCNSFYFHKYRLFIWRNLQLLFIKSSLFGENLSKIFLQSQPYRSETLSQRNTCFGKSDIWRLITFALVTYEVQGACTVWKFGNFSANKILREFNFWSIKICDLTVSVLLNM